MLKQKMLSAGSDDGGGFHEAFFFARPDPERDADNAWFMDVYTRYRGDGRKGRELIEKVWRAIHEPTK